MVEVETFRDARGAFTTPWERGRVNPAFQADSVHFSDNREAGTLRGLHFQEPPHEQTKLVLCLRGRAFDVAVDLRPESPERGRWSSHTLEADSGRALLVPAGHAHGFLTLEPNTLIAYVITGPYRAEAARGLRWNDPALGIEWPRSPVVISDRDRGWPLL